MCLSYINFIAKEQIFKTLAKLIYDNKFVEDINELAKELKETLPELADKIKDASKELLDDLDDLIDDLIDWIQSMDPVSH